MTKQQAYDFFFASLAEEIIAAEDTLAAVDRDDSAYSGLQDCATNLQRLLSALDDIYHALPDEKRIYRNVRVSPITWERSGHLVPSTIQNER